MSHEIHREVIDYSCPSCDTMLVIQGYPSIDEVREAAARGDEEAIRNLPSYEQMESRQRLAESGELKTIQQLPGPAPRGTGLAGSRWRRDVVTRQRAVPGWQAASRRA